MTIITNILNVSRSNVVATENIRSLQESLRNHFYDVISCKKSKTPHIVETRYQNQV